MHTFHEDTIKVFIICLRSNCPRFYRGVHITDGLVITKKLTLLIGIVTWLFMHDYFTTARFIYNADIMRSFRVSKIDRRL